MKLMNPKFIDPVEIKANALAIKIETMLNAKNQKKNFTVNELKSEFPSDAADITQGMIEYIAIKKGWSIDRND